MLTTLEKRIATMEHLMQDYIIKERLLQRIVRMENILYEKKSVLTLDEACRYLGISHSLMYKLTSARAIPHYKPRGKMIFFDRLELETWAKHGGQASITETEECLACMAERQKRATIVQ